MKEQHARSFGKHERLHSRILIERLFKESHPFLSVYPLRMVFFFNSSQSASQPASIQFLISVPKRTFRKATLRNYVKRQIRESVRLNKAYLFEKWPADMKQQLVIGIIYIGKGLVPPPQISGAIQQMFQKFEYRA